MKTSLRSPADRWTVVDPECRVLGCTGLQVTDASIMPEVPCANTHLPTLEIAARVAAQLKVGAAG